MHTTARLIAIVLLAAGAHRALPQGADRETEPVELASTPFELQALGLRFRLPVGATATTRRIGSEAQADIAGPNATYRVTITSRTSSNEELTAETAAESILLNLKEAFGINDGDASRPREATIATFAQELLTVEPVGFEGGNAYRFFVLQPETRNEGRSVRGVAVIQLAPGRMLVWDTNAPEANYTLAAKSLDAMLSTVSFDDPERRVASRGIALEAGRRVLAELSPETLRNVFDRGDDEWFRLYAPNAAGDEEFGYRRVTTWLGTRDEVKLKPGTNHTDDTPGYLVRIEARTLGQRDPSTGKPVIYDSRGTYWASEDLSQETWHLAIAVRDGTRTTSMTEIGVRGGSDELIVTTQNPNGRSDTTSHHIGSEGYLPQPVMLMLPRLLAHTNTAGDFAFYSYRSDNSAVAYRTDSLRREDIGQGWTLRSRVAPDTPELAKSLSTDGSIARERLPDGKIWEPIESNELVRLWKSKNLPMK